MPGTYRITVLHHAPAGRVRFHVERLYRNERQAERVRQRLVLAPGVLKASINCLTGNILVYYDPQWTHLAELKRVIRRRPGKREESERLKSTPWHGLTLEEVARVLESSPERGISEDTAQRHAREAGPNTLRKLDPRSRLEILRNQVDNLPSALLFGSAALAALTGGAADAVVILLVIAINGLIGFKTEETAERSISALTSIAEPWAEVIRDGTKRRLPWYDVTVGDLLWLAPGSLVPADARVVSAHHLSADESMLTGESVPVAKTAQILRVATPALADRRNMIYRGTVITGGSGTALVTAIGELTEVGKIQKLLGESEAPDTPLQKQLQRLGNQMAILSLSVAGLTLAVGYLRGYGLLRMLKTAVSLAVAAIPESLPTIATTTLAHSIRVLKEERLLVRRMDAIETLGEVDVICFDKTGTLTLNQMSVTRITVGARHFHLENGKFPSSRDPDLRQLARIATLCNEASHKNGSPTEQALVRMAAQFGIQAEKLRTRYPLLTTHYRSEARSYMTTVHTHSGGRKLHAVKGRPADVLALCRHYQEQGRIRPLTAAKKRSFIRQNEAMAAEGLRVLGFAYRKGEDRSLIWVGLVGMLDPVRPGLPEVIRKIHAAKIRTVMITGDQARTAHVIGSRLGLGSRAKGGLRVIDAPKLDRVSPAVVKDAHVFARVNPSHKLKIIQALQHSGQVVAMVGDGINDGPALKAADIGIAMGAGGTEVAAQVADIVLEKDNVEKLPLAIREGRTLQQDIKKAVDYILTQNLSEILYTFTAIALGLGEPLTPMQLLWMNLMTDIFPELALAQEPPERDILFRSPAHSEHRFVNGPDLSRMGYESLILTAFSLAAYGYAHRRYADGARARTVGFATLVTGSLLYTWCARSERLTFFDRESLPRNRYVPLAMGAGFVMEALGIFVPGIARALGASRIGARDMVVAGLSSLAPVLWIETSRFTHRPAFALHQR